MKVPRTGKLTSIELAFDTSISLVSTELWLPGVPNR